jgi:hypothetical protein
MATVLNYNGFSGFKIKRPNITTNGIVSDVDPTIKKLLDELDQLLSAPVFDPTAQPVIPFVPQPVDTANAANAANAGNAAAAPEAILPADKIEKNPNLAGKPRPDTAAGHNSGGHTAAGHTAAGQKAAYAAKLAGITGFNLLNLQTELSYPLLPKTYDESTNTWSWGAAGVNSILTDLSNAVKTAMNAGGMSSGISIGSWIDKINPLASLKYQFSSTVSTNWSNLDYNTTVILGAYSYGASGGNSGYINVSNYLIAYAYCIKGITDPDALLNFMSTAADGIMAIVNYAVTSAARLQVQIESLNIPDSVTQAGTLVFFQDDTHPLIQQIQKAGLTLSSASFQTSLDSLIQGSIDNGPELQLINGSQFALVSDPVKQYLIQAIKNYNVNALVPIDATNINSFIPIFLSQLGTAAGQAQISTQISPEGPDSVFDVIPFQDSSDASVISVSNVRCASQLFYCMVLGDELQIFDVATYFTHKYLVRNPVEIRDPVLRQNLQLYVFSNKFVDGSGNIQDRTRPAERGMFYQQVFNYGRSKITDDVIVNTDFARLWKILMFETATYLEKAQLSPNPDTFVSRQNVQQAVEDLQYNLSTHCTGMAIVITPIIYAELSFVVNKILTHPEIMQQVVPVGGTWWRVVETLYAGMKSTKPNALAENNKANYGQQIIKAIAEYVESTFEQDGPYSSFISLVDAYISTESILQKAAGQGDDDQPPAPQQQPGQMPAQQPVMSANGNGKAPSMANNWDF